MIRIQLCLLLVVLLAVDRVHGDVLDALRQIGPEADLVVVVDRAFEPGSAEGLGGLISFVTKLADIKETSQRWDHLANTFGMTGDEAFSALAGQRFALVVFGLGDEEQTQWVVITDVTDETERRVRKHLQAMPRWKINGQYLFAIEDDRYRLASCRGGNSDGGATLVLGPADSMSLIKEVVPSICRKPKFPEAREVSEPSVIDKLIKALDSNQIVGRLRLKSDDEEGVEGADRYIAVGAQVEGARVNARLWSSPGLVLQKDRGRSIWPVASFSELESGSLLWVLGRLGPSTEFEPQIVPTVPKLAMSMLKLDQDSSLLVALAVDPVSEDAGLGVSVAVHSLDARATARGVDALMIPIKAMLEHHVDRSTSSMNSSEREREILPNYDGVLPGAVRTQSVSLSFAMSRDEGADHRAALAWRSQPGIDGSGWAVMRLSPAGKNIAQQVSLMSDALQGQLAQEAGGGLAGGQPLMAGRAKPSRLVDLMEKLGWVGEGELSAWRLIDVLSWNTTLNEDDSIESSITIDLNPGLIR